jgi:hypothetical protein
VHALGVMTLEGEEIYLAPKNNKIPIPRFICKSITPKDSNISENYVFYNNPYASVTEIVAEIAEVFGSGVEYLSGNFVNPQKGYTFKVTNDVLQRVVNDFQTSSLPREE